MNFEYTLTLNRDNEWAMDKHHFHDQIEILLSLTDAGNIFANNTLYPLKKGSLLILKDTTLHKTIASNCNLYERYILHFSSEILRELSTNQTNLLAVFNTPVNYFFLNEAELTKVISMFESCRHLEDHIFGNDLRKNIAFIQLLLHLSSLVKKDGDSHKPKNKNFEKISPMLEFINNNIDQELTLDLLANKFYMNKFHLSRTFKTVTGFTLMTYVINCRILKSRELLRKGYSVQEAGELSGFNNNAHFIRTFGKYTGISPGKYMKLYKESRNQ